MASMIGRWPVAIAGKQLGDARLVHQVARQLHVERRQGDGGVGDHLDRGAAGAEQDDRAEQRVLADADDQLMGAGPRDHRLNREALDRGVGRLGGDAVEDALGGVGRRLRRADAEHHAADVGLVADVTRQQLHRHRRVAGEQVGRDCLGLLDVVGDQRFHHRHAESGERRLGLRLGQRRAAVGDHVGEELARRGNVGRHLRRRRRRLHQLALGGAVAGEVGEGADGFRRRLVGGHARLAQDGARRGGVVLAEPAGQDRLEARRMLGVDIAHGVGHRLSRAGRRGQCRRAGHDQQGVDIVVVEDALDGGAITLRPGVADDVDRVCLRPCRRQDLVERVEGLLGDRRDLAAIVDHAVDGENAGATAIGDDAQPPALDGREAGERLGGLEQLFQVGDAQQTGAAEGGVGRAVAAGQRAGVGGGGLGAGGVAAGLDDDDRLHARGGAGRRHELARVVDGLEVEKDGARVAVGGEHVEHVGDVDIGHVAERDDGGEADLAVDRPVEHGGGERPRLRQEGELAGLRRDVGEAGVEADAGNEHAEAVRPEDAQHVRLGGVEHELAQPALAGEAGGQHHSGAGAALAELGDDGGNRLAPALRRRPGPAPPGERRCPGNRQGR